MFIFLLLCTLWAAGCTSLTARGHAQSQMTAQYYRASYDAVFLHALHALAGLNWTLTQQDADAGLIVGTIPSSIVTNEGSITIHLKQTDRPSVAVTAVATTGQGLDFGQSQRNADAFLTALGQRLWAASEEEKRSKQGF